MIPAAASWSAVRPAVSRGGGRARRRGRGRPRGAAPGHRGEAGQPGRVVAVGVQVDRAAVLGGDLQHRRRVPGRVGVQVGAAADDRRAHLHGVPEQGEALGPGDPGEQPGDGDRGQVGEAAQRPAGLEDGLQRGEPLDVADPDVGAQGGGAVAELEQGGLGGAALDVLGAVGCGPRAVRVGGEGGVAVGVGFGRGGEQEVAAQVDAGAAGGEAARGADGLDTAAAEAYVDGAAVGEAGAAQDEGGGGVGGGRVGAVRRVVVGPPWPAVGHRAPGRGAGPRGAAGPGVVPSIMAASATRGTAASGRS